MEMPPQSWQTQRRQRIGFPVSSVLAKAPGRIPRRVEISVENAERLGLRSPVHSSRDGVFFGTPSKYSLNGAQRQLSSRRSIAQCRRGMTCGVALCALCSPRRARRQRYHLLDALRDAQPGYALLWTYTIASTPDRALGLMVRDLTRLMTAVNQSGWLSGQVDGYARVIEIERPVGGWHPHGHVLLCFQKRMTRAEARAFALTLRDRYLDAATRLGIDASAAGHHVRVVPLDQIETTARYITKQHVMTQPKRDGTATLASLTMDAYSHGDADALDLLREVEGATYKKQLWRTAGVCKPPSS